MRTTIKKARTVLFAVFGLWCLGLTQCSGVEGLSKDVKITLVPEDPVVINADITLYANTENEVVIRAPWYLFRSSVTNNSDKTLYFVTYTFKVTGRKDGRQVTSNHSIDPNFSCFSDTLSRPYLAIITPGTTYKQADSCDSTSYDDLAYEAWYIHGLPEADSFDYSVDVTAEGWFVNADGVPIERLVYDGYQFTQ